MTGMAGQVAQSQTTTTGLWSQLVVESIKLGPMAQAYMAWRAAPYMLSGIVPFGAAQVIAATDYSKAAAASIGRMTAIMVRLTCFLTPCTIAVTDGGQMQPFHSCTFGDCRKWQDNPGQHLLTISQVKLGFVKLVASITSQCVRQDRPDAVAKVHMTLRTHVLLRAPAANRSHSVLDTSEP